MKGGVDVSSTGPFLLAQQLSSTHVPHRLAAIKQILPTGDDPERLPIESCRAGLWYPSESVRVIAGAIAIM